MSGCILTVLLLLVITIHFSFGVYIDAVKFQNEDKEKAGIQHETKTTSYTTHELQCYSKQQIPYGDNCYKLLTRGPCDVGEWLILDFELATQKHPQLVAVCSEKQCNNNDIFWPKDGYCYNVTEGDSPLCQEHGTYLHVDPFGEGICDCKLDGPYIRWFTSSESPTFQCYEAYSKGPCVEGSIIVRRNGRVTCQIDPCFDHQRKNKRYVLWEEDDGCYQLRSRGPCPNDSELIIHQETKAPGCISLSNPLHLIDLPTICKTDHLGECVEEIHISSNSDKFRDKLIQLANEKKRKASLL